jgi:hypothetical protein
MGLLSLLAAAWLRYVSCWFLCCFFFREYVLEGMMECRWIGDYDDFLLVDMELDHWPSGDTSMYERTEDGELIVGGRYKIGDAYFCAYCNVSHQGPELEWSRCHSCGRDM